MKNINDIPKQWDDIKLKDYKNLMNFYKEHNNQPTEIQLLSYFMEINENEIYNLDNDLVMEYVKKLQFLKNPISNKQFNFIFINNEKYFVNHLEKLKFKEFVDTQTVLENDKYDYTSMLAILCRKEGEIYNDDFIANKFEKRKEIFDNQPITKIMPIVNFFLTLCLISENFFRQYSIIAEEQLSRLQNNIKNSPKNGAGQKLISKLAMTKLKTWKKQLRSI